MTPVVRHYFYFITVCKVRANSYLKLFLAIMRRNARVFCVVKKKNSKRTYTMLCISEPVFILYITTCYESQSLPPDTRRGCAHL